MPELPEVETVRLQLLYKVLKKKIKNVEVYNPKTVASDENFAKKLKGKSISHVDRVGKLLIFEFDKNDNFFLLTHLKMTGQFFYSENKKIISGGGHSITNNQEKNLPDKHTRVAFYFIDGSALFFNDMRKFGYIKIADNNSKALAKNRFGQEPIGVDFDLNLFTEGIKKRKTSIKAVLLDQTFIAGLGNIYVDEALFSAKVHPARPANLITKAEAKKIIKAGGDIMNKSIEVGGTTFQSFKDTNGKNGSYFEHIKIFAKQNTPCPVCGTMIKKIKVAGRGTHFCPKCQK